MAGASIKSGIFFKGKRAPRMSRCGLDTGSSPTRAMPVGVTDSVFTRTGGRYYNAEGELPSWLSG